MYFTGVIKSSNILPTDIISVLSEEAAIVSTNTIDLLHGKAWCFYLRKKCF
jgi:hypothetical protein